MGGSPTHGSPWRRQPRPIRAWAGVGELTVLTAISRLLLSAQSLGQTKGLGKHLESKHP